jgi:adenine specific DNA methylase Mod
MQLTEEEINEYLKMKQQKEKKNKYFYNYTKNKIKDAKINNPELYKRFMDKQNEANKKYKKAALIKLKEDPIKYKEFRDKELEYRKLLKIRKEQEQNLLIC